MNLFCARKETNLESKIIFTETNTQQLSHQHFEYFGMSLSRSDCLQANRLSIYDVTSVSDTSALYYQFTLCSQMFTLVGPFAAETSIYYLYCIVYNEATFFLIFTANLFVIICFHVALVMSWLFQTYW